MARYPDWPGIESLLRNRSPLRIPVPGSPPISILVEPSTPKLAILVPFVEEQTLPSIDLEAIELSVVSIDGQQHLQLATRLQPIFEEFFSLVISVIDLIQLHQIPVVEAIQQRIDAWRALLKSVSVLSEDRQLGLIGELWLLERLLRLWGPAALASWTGPLGEPHDFRRDAFEFEVKSTRNLQRLHVINSLQQLLPSPERKLFILSLQFEPTSGTKGRTLPEAVQVIRELLNNDKMRLKQFNECLSLYCGYAETHTSLYKAKYQLRTIPILIPVDESCPRVTPISIKTVLGADLAARVSDVRYRINVENMGFEENSAEFRAILPYEEEP